MATVLVRYDRSDVPIVTGNVPPDPQTPIEDPEQTEFVTNQAFIVAPGAYCYALQTTEPYAPLWQVVRAADGEQAEIIFRMLR